MPRLWRFHALNIDELEASLQKIRREHGESPRENQSRQAGTNEQGKILSILSISLSISIVGLLWVPQKTAHVLFVSQIFAFISAQLGSIVFYALLSQYQSIPTVSTHRWAIEHSFIQSRWEQENLPNQIRKTMNKITLFGFCFTLAVGITLRV